MSETLLFVDDEKQILRSLKRVFLGSTYNVLTAENGEEALKILKQEKIDLLITDIKMPVMCGYQLLKEVKLRYPSTIRLILSGNVDMDTLLKIQNNCLAKLYLFKPWQNQELIRVIDNIFSVEKILVNKNMFEVINGVDSLPSSINIYNQFNLLVEEEADMKQIAYLVESDPAITAKVLQVANSALYGKKIGSIFHAITYLGIMNVKNIVFSASLYKSLGDINNKYIIRDMNTLWVHSVMTNKILSFLYQRLLNKKIPNDCAMAGLLHDIGKVILLSKYTEEYMKATTNVSPDEDKFHYYEEMSFSDISHSEVGGYLLSWWELPYPIVESALFHHNPLDENVIDKELVSLVHISDIYSWNIISKDRIIEIDEEVLKNLEITKVECANLLEEIKTAIL